MKHFDHRNRRPGGNMQRQQEVNINIDRYAPVKCEACGHDIFYKRHQIRVVPGVAVGQAQPIIVFSDLYFCEDCDTLLGPQATKEEQNEEAESVILKP